MSVTVNNLLKLPSLRNARVLAGEKGMGRAVSSISVLESTDPAILQEPLFQNDVFYGSEIVITGFVNVPDNVELQCANIRRLAEGGEVGLILYYVGIFMPRVDRKLIELADSLGFVLICMPENRMDLRYSEVICEVMEAIYKDQATETSLVTELLEQVSCLARHQRTVDTALKMVSDRLHASLLLTDASLRVINAAAWPRSLGDSLAENLHRTVLPERDGPYVFCQEEPNSFLYRAAIETGDGTGMDLFLFKEGEALNPVLWRQVTELTRLAVNIWSDRHDEVAVAELVRAIMQDEPIKMQRLADIFHIDVASIHSMWVLRAPDDDGRRSGEGKGPESLEGLLAPVRAAVLCRGRTVVADIYQKDLVIFMSGPETMQEADELAEGLLAICGERGISAVLTRCGHLSDTAAAREAFLANQSYLADARRVFRRRFQFDLGDILFVRDCRNQLEEGKSGVAQGLAALDFLGDGKDAAELRETLSVHLLDGGASVTRTAELLYLHKNTIKYRLQKISDRLGCRVGRMPESLSLYRACAMERLLS